MAGQRNGRGKRSNSQSDYGDKGGSKRRHSGDDRDPFVIDKDDTVYRYLCPVRRIGSIIGRGGEIAKQLRADTKSKIRIDDTVEGCDERVITIHSSSDETNEFEGADDLVCPAQEALFKVHEKVIGDNFALDEDSDGSEHVTARLLVPSDQIGAVIGKGGNVIQNIRSESGAHVRIVKEEHIPLCALRSDELIQISGEPSVVKKALLQIAVRLHDNPSRSQNLLPSATPIAYQTAGQLMGPAAVAPIMGLTPLVGQYGGYRGDALDWPHPIYHSSKSDTYPKEFSLRLVCLVENVGGVIGKNGVIINQIRQESGANIRVDSSAAEGDDCLITISAKEVFDDSFSPVVEAAVRLQPRCSDKIERDSGIISFMTRLLVPSLRIGCLIGKGGCVINEMRKATKANIRILPKESLPKVASDEDELVQISGDLEVAKCALISITTRLRANIFEREASTFVPLVPYLPMSDRSDGLREERDGKRRGRSYSDGYGASDLAPSDGYGSYGTSQHGVAGSGYGLSSDYGTGRTSSYGISGQSSVSRRRNYGY